MYHTIPSGIDMPATLESTPYSSSYCQLLIDHMARGFTFRSFASIIGVCYTVLYRWCSEYPELLTARNIGQMKSLYYWEKMLLDYLADPAAHPKFNTAIWKFNIQSRFPELYGTKTAAFVELEELTLNPERPNPATDVAKRKTSKASSKAINSGSLSAPVDIELPDHDLLVAGAKPVIAEQEIVVNESVTIAPQDLTKAQELTPIFIKEDTISEVMSKDPQSPERPQENLPQYDPLNISETPDPHAIEPSPKSRQKKLSRQQRKAKCQQQRARRL